MNKFLLFLVLFTFDVLAQKAYFCRGCNDEASAKTQALQYVPELRCDFDPILLPELGDSAAACRSEVIRVVLINPLSPSKVYAFYVGHNAASPYRPFAELDALTYAERIKYSDVSMAYTRVSQGILQAQQISVTSENSDGLFSASVSSCPQNTALDVLTDPQKMEDLKIRTRLAVGLGLGDGQGIDLSKVNWNGVGFSYKGVSVNWSATTKQLIFSRSFELSEVSGPISDVLVFKLEYLGVDSKNNLPLLNFELNSSSIVAGMTLSGLQGQFGALAITNSCILEKLERLEEQGEFRDGRGSPVELTPPSGGAADDSPDLCIYDFYNSRGEREYTFRAPCP